ncbi:hypothetical protein V6Z11_D11G387800 [Gossypium hirsutum]
MPISANVLPTEEFVVYVKISNWSSQKRSKIGQIREIKKLQPAPEDADTLEFLPVIESVGYNAMDRSQHFLYSFKNYSRQKAMGARALHTPPPFQIWEIRIKPSIFLKILIKLLNFFKIFTKPFNSLVSFN